MSMAVFNKTSFMVTEIWISRVTKYYLSDFFLAIQKRKKTILAYRPYTTGGGPDCVCKLQFADPYAWTYASK